MSLISLYAARFNRIATQLIANPKPSPFFRPVQQFLKVSEPPRNKMILNSPRPFKSMSRELPNDQLSSTAKNVDKFSSSLIDNSSQTLSRAMKSPSLQQQQALVPSRLMKPQMKMENPFRSFSSQKPPEQRASRDINLAKGHFSEINTGKVVKVTGGGVLALLLAGYGTYLACEKNPDYDICETLRTKVGLKKKSH